MVSSRRNFILGAGAVLIAAPAIIRAEALMVLRGVPMISGLDVVYVGGPLSMFGTIAAGLKAVRAGGTIFVAEGHEETVSAPWVVPIGVRHTRIIGTGRTNIALPSEVLEIEGGPAWIEKLWFTMPLNPQSFDGLQIQLNPAS